MAVYFGGPIKQYRGPYLKLITLLKFRDEIDEFISQEYEVNNMAAVRFLRNNYLGHLKCSVSARKLDTAKDFSVELKISSNHLHCSELLLQIHSEDWTEWKYLGTTEDFQSPDTTRSMLMYMIQVDIVASKMESSNVHITPYHDEEFIDFHLGAADGKVGFHKVFLAGRSDVFRRMLLGQWKETADGCVELEGLTQKTLQHLKDYLYLDTLPDDGLRPLLLLARYFLINDLKAKCIKKLVGDVSADNLYSLLEFACENNVPELTFEILHVTPDETVNLAYKKKFCHSEKNEDN